VATVLMILLQIKPLNLVQFKQ